MKNKLSKRTIIILIIYTISLIIFNIHIEQYQSYIEEFPDELSHIAYIAYLDETGKIIPEFENMKETEKYKIHLREYRYEIMDMQNEKQPENIEKIETRFFENTTNHLGHPPLYYHIMRLFNLVKVENGNITYNLKALRNVSQIISNIALMVVFIFTYKNLKSILANFVFAILLVNIPLLPYVSGAVSNDVLSLLGLSVFLIGASELVKEKRNYFTYFLLAVGTFICMMNKVTTGLIIIIAYLIMFLYLVIKEKNIKFIMRKEFYATIPIYICILFYYFFIIQKYGAVQPLIQVIAPEYYKTTSFYNSTIYKPAYSLNMYSKMYWNNFVNYWAGYNYGKRFPKHELKESLISISIFTTPIIFFIIEKIRKKKIDIVNLAICMGVYIAIIIQFIRQFIEFKTLSRIFRRLSFKILCMCNAFIYIFDLQISR